MWLMLQQDAPDDFVIGTGKTHTIREFIHCVSEIAGYDIMKHVVIDEKFMRPSEVPLLLADPSKAKEKLGWSPKVELLDLAKIMYASDLEKEKQNVR